MFLSFLPIPPSRAIFQVYIVLQSALILHGSENKLRTSNRIIGKNLRWFTDWRQPWTREWRRGLENENNQKFLLTTVYTHTHTHSNLLSAFFMETYLSATWPVISSGCGSRALARSFSVTQKERTVQFYFIGSFLDAVASFRGVLFCFLIRVLAAFVSISAGHCSSTAIT